MLSAAGLSDAFCVWYFLCRKSILELYIRFTAWNLMKARMIDEDWFSFRLKDATVGDSVQIRRVDKDTIENTRRRIGGRGCYSPRVLY